MDLDSQRKNLKKDGVLFSKGNVGGTGRPPGSRNKTTRILDQLGDENGPKVMEALMKAAMEGDGQAQRFLIAQIWPPIPGRTLTVEMPPITSLKEALETAETALNLYLVGEISNAQLKDINEAVEGYRKLKEVTALETRMQDFERRLKEQV